MAAEDHRGDARPLRHRGRRATAPPIDVVAGPQRPGASPLPPSIAGSLLRAVKPVSPSSSAPLPPLPCARGCGCEGGPGGRRSTLQLEQRPLGSRPLCFCPFLCPLANRRMRIRFGGGHYLVHPRLYPQVRLDAADFPFFRSKIVCVAQPFVFDPSSTLPKDKVVAAPTRLL